MSIVTKYALTLLIDASLLRGAASANNFVPNGRISFTQAVKIKAGHDGSGLFYRLLTQMRRVAGTGHDIRYMIEALKL